MADVQQPQTTATDGVGAEAVQFSIDKIYVKDLSLENPSAPQSFMSQESPQLEVGLRTRGEQVQPDIYECVLTITLTAKTGDKTLFLVEASQAGCSRSRAFPPISCSRCSRSIVRRCSFPTRARRSPTPSVALDFRRCTSRPSTSRCCISSSSRSSRAPAPRTEDAMTFLSTRALVAAALAAACAIAHAADYRTVAEPVAILFDAPSSKAKPLFLLSRDTPLEVIVALEGWTKVRDASGTIGWIEKKALNDRHSLVVRAHVADVRANPEDNAPVVFRAEQNVVLELAETAASPTTTATPGWVKVRHRDGQSGFVRINQVFGF